MSASVFPSPKTVGSSAPRGGPRAVIIGRGIGNHRPQRRPPAGWRRRAATPFGNPSGDGAARPIVPPSPLREAAMTSRKAHWLVPALVLPLLALAAAEPPGGTATKERPAGRVTTNSLGMRLA